MVETLTGVRIPAHTRTRPTFRLPRQRRRDFNDMYAGTVLKPYDLVCIQVLTPDCGYRRNRGTLWLNENKKSQKPVFHLVTLDFASMLPEVGGY